MKSILQIISLTCLLCLFTYVDASASTGGGTKSYSSRNGRHLSAQQIRNMPLLQRPNRPGHFIGNTIRGMHRQRSYSMRGR